ncbi:MAG: S8/S53 family peptidase [Propionibacteriaceae bacterium]|nr:S8/S53 family peptidase [Propionibacteriaceae bacterium]
MIGTTPDISDAKELAPLDGSAVPIEHFSRCWFSNWSLISDSTNAVSALLGPDWGWARDVNLISGGRDPDSALRCDRAYNTLSYAIHRAINLKADIILVSHPGGGDPDQAFGYAVARAALLGVPIVIAASDLGSTDFNAFAAVNGVIAVGGATLDGKAASWSPRGHGMTLVAPGTINGRNASFETALDVSSTSTAAAMVAGLLARGLQAWPEASGNQLVASMIATASGSGVWTPDMGWGMINPGPFFANDPSQYPDVNPLLSKMAGDPADSVLTKRMLKDYASARALPEPWIVPYGDYQYTAKYEATKAALAEQTRVAQIESVWGLIVLISLPIVLAGLIIILVGWGMREQPGPVKRRPGST